MTELNCFRCQKRVGDGLDELKSHFNFTDRLLMSGTKLEAFICSQDGCPLNFNLFSSLKKHITKYHLRDAPTGDHDPATDAGSEDENMPDRDERNQSDNGDVNLSLTDHELEDVNIKRVLSQQAAKIILKMRANSAVTASIVSERGRPFTSSCSRNASSALNDRPQSRRKHDCDNWEEPETCWSAGATLSNPVFIYSEACIHVVIDADIIEVGQSFVNAADILFKLHYIFNLQYSPALEYVFQFLQCYVYCIRDTKPSSVVDAFNEHENSKCKVLNLTNQGNKCSFSNYAKAY